MSKEKHHPSFAGYTATSFVGWVGVFLAAVFWPAISLLLRSCQMRGHY
jgi:hypothetical protein